MSSLMNPTSPIPADVIADLIKCATLSLREDGDLLTLIDLGTGKALGRFETAREAWAWATQQRERADDRTLSRLGLQGALPSYLRDC